MEPDAAASMNALKKHFFLSSNCNCNSNCNNSHPTAIKWMMNFTITPSTVNHA